MLQFSVKQSDFDVLKQWDYDDDNDLGVDNNHDNNYADDDYDDNVDNGGDDKNDDNADKGGGHTIKWKFFMIFTMRRRTPPPLLV